MPHHSVCWGWWDSVYRARLSRWQRRFPVSGPAGHHALPTRNAEGIRALVSLLAPNTRAIITEPDPVKVHIDNRSGLGPETASVFRSGPRWVKRQGKHAAGYW
jgi:hypothetical protein